MHHSLSTTLSIGLSIGPIRVAACFRVIDAYTSYHATQEGLGSQTEGCAHHHQCLQAIWKGKQAHVNASECPFIRDETYFLDADLFDEIAEDREIALAGR